MYFSAKKALFSAISIVALSMLILPDAALAHATLEKTQSPSGTSYKGVIRIGHGCNGSATISLRVQLPEGVIAAKPMPKPGWNLTTVKGNYEKAHDYYGKPLSEGVRDITWSGNKLSDEHYDEFIFTSYLSKAVPEGATLYFPILQECERGANKWVEIPGAGQDGHSLKEPAPALRINSVNGATATKSTLKFGNLTISQSWLREPPPGSRTAGGFVKISNEGQVSDRLLGVETAVSSSTEIHEMRHVDGIAKMRALDQGLEIKPGESVDLKPGGLHIMFQGLREVPKPGESIATTLVFEKAGRVAVDFRVEPLNSKATNDEHAGHRE